MTESTSSAALDELPLGFQVAAVACGIKQDPAQPVDLALIISDAPCVAAGVYTQNQIVAAPVLWDRNITPTNAARAVVINSGNANACTGDQGTQDTQRMAELVAASIAAQPGEVLVLSTGIIGEFLPMEKIATGIETASGTLGRDRKAIELTARGMMTTDRVPKIAQRQVSGSDGPIHITGFAKGAGMIGPNMATLLCVVLTDAVIDPSVAQTLLKQIADRTFNCISVEGHTSTNDTVLLLSSGRAALEESSSEFIEFSQQLEATFRDLARQIPADGEGATHLISICIRGTEDDAKAKQLAQTIANSPLVKTAMTGADPNWGRIISAAGYSGINFDPADLILSINSQTVYTDGKPTGFDATALSQSIANSFEVIVELRIGDGPGSCDFWTSDLTHDYITINADYHT